MFRWLGLLFGCPAVSSRARDQLLGPFGSDEKTCFLSETNFKYISITLNCELLAVRRNAKTRFIMNFAIAVTTWGFCTRVRGGQTGLWLFLNVHNIT